jgi:hypothetical protein
MFLRHEVFSDLLPFQEKVISTKITPDGRYKLSCVCKQNFLSVYVYLDAVSLQSAGDPVRSFVAERDVTQDCGSFLIQTVEPSTLNGSLTVNFLEGRNARIELR